MISAVLFVLAGLLAGGAFSTARQGAPVPVTVVIAALAGLAAVGGVLWYLPGDA